MTDKLTAQASSPSTVVICGFYALLIAGLMVVPLVARSQTSTVLLQPKTANYGPSFRSDAVQLHVEPGPANATFLIVDRPDRSSVSITLPLPVNGDVRFEPAIDGKIIVELDDGGGATLLSILDVNAGKIIDQFVCYDPVLAPNGRYIAVRKFFPEHGVDRVQSSAFEMIYDLRSPTRRLGGESKLGDIFDTQGRLVYPVRWELPVVKRYGIQVSHDMIAPPIWAPSSTKLVLLDSVFPGDPISAGAMHDGNLRHDAAVRPAPASKLILIALDGGVWRARQYDTGICTPGSSMCESVLMAAKFSELSVSVDVGQEILIPFDKFVAIKS